MLLEKNLLRRRSPTPLAAKASRSLHAGVCTHQRFFSKLILTCPDLFVDLYFGN